MKKSLPPSLLLLVPSASWADIPPWRPPTVACTEMKPRPGEFCAKCTSGGYACQRTFTEERPSWEYRCTSGEVEYWCVPWDGTDPPPRVPTPAPPSSYSRGGVPNRNRSSPPPPQTDEEAARVGLQGLIETTQREGDKLALYIDKGAAAGIKVGTEGVVLDGKAGFLPLDGAHFRVVRIINDNHCIAEIPFKSLGKSKRVSLFIKR